tara:strand:- start:914 stop:1252 length:339 start_codon:yes stop_codon:yes gene_type:complete
MPLFYIREKFKKRKRLPLTPSLKKAREDHAEYLKSLGYKKIPKSDYTAFNDINMLNADKKRKTVAIKSMNTTHMGNGAPKRKAIEHNFTVAPAYNKGAYQVISKDDIKDIGK